MSTDSNPVKLIGRYRIVRKLGHGVRAEVYLAHPHQEGSTPVVIKAFRPGVADASIGAEVEALVRANGEHSLKLLDVTSAADGMQALILQRVAGPSLARLVSDRERLRLGEAITILAPLCGAVSRLHRRGVVHFGISDQAVLFDSMGAPVLACFGRAFLITPEQPPALLNAVPGIALDIQAFARLAIDVLARVDDAIARELCDWARSGPALETDAWFEQFADRLFDSGVAEPVSASSELPPYGHREYRSAPSAHPLRYATDEVGLASAGPESAPEPTKPRSSRMLESLARFMPEGLIPQNLDAGLPRLRGALAVVRPRVWFVGAAVVAAFVIAIAIVPQGGHATANSPPIHSAAGMTAPAVEQTVIDADDPIAALVALLAARDGCVHDLSVLCLDEVDQNGSSALSDDQQLIRSIQTGGQSPASLVITPAQVSLDERLGDSALLKLGDVPDAAPASVLIMKTTDGWRVRDYLQK